MPADDATALLRSLGPPPLDRHSLAGEHYLATVVERAAALATGLAATAQLLADADDDADGRDDAGQRRRLLGRMGQVADRRSRHERCRVTSDTTKPERVGSCRFGSLRERCSRPWWRLDRTLERARSNVPIPTTTEVRPGLTCPEVADQEADGLGADVADAPVQALGRVRRRPAPGALPHRGDAHPLGAVLRLPRHVRSLVGLPRRPGLGLRLRRPPHRPRPPDPGSADPGVRRSVGQDADLPVEQQRLRVLRAAHPPDPGDGRDLRAVGPSRSTTHRALRRTTSARSRRTCRSGPPSCACSVA